MERVIAFSIEHVLVQNVLQFHRNFGVPAAFHGNQDTANELNLLCLLFLDAVSDLLQIFFIIFDAMSQKSKLL